jgi:AraC-like DNA-binding protein
VDHHLELVRPVPFLARFIEDMRVVTPLAGHAFQYVERLPDGTVSLLFRCHAGSRVSSRAGVSPVSHAVCHPGDLCLAGPRRRALFKVVRPAPLSVVIRFKPGGASPFFGVPASELTDRVVGLDDLWGAEGMHLRERLASARGTRAMLDALQEALLARARRASEPVSAQLARRAVQLLAAHDAAPRVQDLAARLGVSDRHLRRAFVATVGVSPKAFARMVRLQRAVCAAATPQAWTGIAAQAGYYDQAHMIAEFHELVGASPGAFMKQAADRAIRWASPDCTAT